MDLKVYKKELVRQPSGNEYVFVPNVIDIIPELIEATTSSDIRNNTWSLEKLKKIADVSIVDGKLIINSDNVRYENGNLYVTLYEEQLAGCEILDDGDHDLAEQACALATIWQKGLDPVSPEVGIRWSETLLGEVNPVQLMEDIREAVEETSLSANVIFDTFVDANGNEYLQYKIQGVA